MKPHFLLSIAVIALVLAGCSAAVPTANGSAQSASSASQSALSNPTSNAVKTDTQGAVTVAVTPLNLSNPSDTLDFTVALNTHSFDLGIDLATLATLTTDTGVTVTATKWDAPNGGHHVTGKLSFPASINGKPFLQDAKQLTLTVHDLDIPERTFQWEISQ